MPHGRSNGYATPFDPSAPTITLSMYTEVGNAALFARIDNASTVSASGPVTAANAQYSVAPMGSTIWENVVIAQSDPAYASAGCAAASTSDTPCTISLSVFDNTTGTSGSSQYILTAFADVREVTDGIPVQAIVQAAPSMIYFRYVATARAPFTITVSEAFHVFYTF